MLIGRKKPDFITGTNAVVVARKKSRRNGERIIELNEWIGVVALSITDKGFVVPSDSPDIQSYTLSLCYTRVQVY